MKLDNEQQRSLLLQIISQAQFPGAMVKVAGNLISSIEGAEVTEVEKTELKSAKKG